MIKRVGLTLQLVSLRVISLVFQLLFAADFLLFKLIVNRLQSQLKEKYT